MITAVRKTKTDLVTKQLPLWKVILHNDPINKFEIVVGRLMEFVHLTKEDAFQKAVEAHTSKASLIAVTKLSLTPYLWFCGWSSIAERHISE